MWVGGDIYIRNTQKEGNAHTRNCFSISTKNGVGFFYCVSYEMPFLLLF